ncbi:hypothetical protein MHH28_14880 [Paenibacillus sp. FSL K6-1217]|uniref:hypothetical protein n=1 Tax=Paenibacillus sp. FSL K6-1217 TaxID=2921466 RepID=UPI003250E5C1
MQTYVPHKLMPWVTFGNDTVNLKAGAPAEVKLLYEKLKADMKKSYDTAFPKDGTFPKL